MFRFHFIKAQSNAGQTVIPNGQQPAVINLESNSFNQHVELFSIIADGSAIFTLVIIVRFRKFSS